MDDVEDRVRTAPPESPAPRKRATRSVLLVAAAFVVAAGGVTAAVTLRDDNQHWGTEAPAYAGSRWNLRTIGGAEVPADLGVFVSFTPGDDFRGYDGVNSMVGHYDATPNSVRLRDIALTYAAYAGDDPVRTAVISAMNEFLVRGAQLSVTSDQLVVRTTAQEMVFTRSGPAIKPSGSP